MTWWKSKTVNLKVDLTLNPGWGGEKERQLVARILCPLRSFWWNLAIHGELLLFYFSTEALYQDYSWIYDLNTNLLIDFFNFKLIKSSLLRHKRRLLSLIMTNKWGPHLLVDCIMKAKLQPSVHWWKVPSEDTPRSEQSQKSPIGSCCWKISETACWNAQNWDFTDSFRVLKN